MSRYVREKIIESLKLLENMTSVIENKINREEEIADILVDCQNCAIAIGSYIEKLGNNNSTTVKALEGYCEQLYDLSQSDGSVSIEALKNKTIFVKDEYDKEYPPHKEVVFLPYKAAMWDSLESVWMAAKDDPDTDCYVIPIPYYDKNPDGSFGEMHYEGDQYPDYVPITHYQDYDIELHHPDQIYIHNPYDNTNHVTSIMPDFYSERIKDLTDELVYIPYFVLSEMTLEQAAHSEKMHQFCVLPGTIYAHKVIVQSENMKQIYIQELLSEANEYGQNITREELENKILGTGSPKFDKVLRTKIEDIELPEEWKKLIYKTDGSKKKVFLYNTSVNSFLQHTDMYLQKMRSVLQTFKENQEEVTLLWRPHPLMMATIESLREDIKQEYIDIVETYKEEGWGIYDDSADLNRAIAISDAYYGDGSSVVQLCQKKKMPVMIQNVYV